MARPLGALYPLVLTVQVSREMRSQIWKQAEIEDRSVASLCRRAFKFYLDAQHPNYSQGLSPSDSQVPTGTVEP